MKIRRGVVFMRTFGKSSKLDNVLYDVRVPVVDEGCQNGRRWNGDSEAEYW